jgi:hypothetical protein
MRGISICCAEHYHSKESRAVTSEPWYQKKRHRSKFGDPDHDAKLVGLRRTSTMNSVLRVTQIASGGQVENSSPLMLRRFPGQEIWEAVFSPYYIQELHGMMEIVRHELNQRELKPTHCDTGFGHGSEHQRAFAGTRGFYIDLHAHPARRSNLSSRSSITQESRLERVPVSRLTNSDSGSGSSRVKQPIFSEKTAGNRHFVETLLLECDIRMLEKLFN